ncbi:MAG: hypothetical protein IT381_13280 [Deltaproteobacteria bacterium]|nr:hypothetical protein [Deltaproteobacteria bacterium]
MGPVSILLLATAAAGGQWELVHPGPDAIVEKRANGDGFYEIRVTKVSDVSAAAIADAYWNERETTLKTQKKYVVLSRTADEKVAYLQLHLPIVKDRDYTIRIARYFDAVSGLFQFSGRCVSDTGPPPNDDHVRVTACTAQLTLEPAGDGRTVVTYVAFANPEGRIPKWVVNAVAAKAVIEVVDKLIELGRDRASQALSSGGR